MNTFNCCEVGAPGSGKTYMATLTLPDDCYPVALVDVDNKANKMFCLQPLIKARKVLVLPVDEPLVADSFKQRTASITMRKGSLIAKISKKPMGYELAVNLLNKAMELAVEGKVKTIVLDSITRLQEHQQRLLIALNQEGFMTLNAYGSSLTIMEELVHGLLTAKCNVIITCHDKIVKDELTGSVSYKPILAGQMADKLESYFEESYVMQPTKTAKGIDYKVLTQSVGLRNARTSRPLDTLEPANFRVILKKGVV